MDFPPYTLKSIYYFFMLGNYTAVASSIGYANSNKAIDRIKIFNISFNPSIITFFSNGIENKFFNPNNLRFPNSRILLEKGF